MDETQCVQPSLPDVRPAVKLSSLPSSVKHNASQYIIDVLMNIMPVIMLLTDAWGDILKDLNDGEDSRLIC